MLGHLQMSFSLVFHLHPSPLSCVPLPLLDSPSTCIYCEFCYSLYPLPLSLNASFPLWTPLFYCGSWTAVSIRIIQMVLMKRWFWRLLSDCFSSLILVENLRIWLLRSPQVRTTGIKKIKYTEFTALFQGSMRNWISQHVWMSHCHRIIGIWSLMLSHSSCDWQISTQCLSQSNQSMPV